MELRDLKYKVYEAAYSKESLLVFEEWLYSGELEFTAEDDFIYELFIFPYKQSGAFHKFKSLINEHLDEEEMNFVYAKRSLEKIISGKCNIELTVKDLHGFLYWDYEGDVQSFTYSVYEYEDYSYSLLSKMEVDEKVKREAVELLEKMKAFESQGKFRLDEFEKL